MLLQVTTAHNNAMPASSRGDGVQTGPSHALGSMPRYPGKLRQLTQPHIESFDYFLREGLHEGVKDIPQQDFFVGTADMDTSEKTRVRWWIESVTVGAPSKNDGSRSSQLLPRECRERGLVYGAPLRGSFAYCIGEGDDAPVIRTTRNLGLLPIMVLSSACRLRGMGPRELAEAHKEEASEFGGYFVVNGIERVVRLLQVPRRNYPMCVQRSAFKGRGANYSDKAVTMRCARCTDQSTQTVALHYLNTGACTLRLSIRKQEFLVPLVVLLRALGECTDLEIYTRLLMGEHENMFLAARLELLLADGKKWGVRTRREALAFLGKRFREVMTLSESWTDAECGAALLKRHVLVHLSHPKPRNAQKIEVRQSSVSIVS
jgi:DNA-directed RNA polymerase I subunit RPA2